ncbi:MAG: hypothetical protein ACLUJG_18365 [Lawsonibacter sp.]
MGVLFGKISIVDVLVLAVGGGDGCGRRLCQDASAVRSASTHHHDTPVPTRCLDNRGPGLCGRTPSGRGSPGDVDKQQHRRLLRAPITDIQVMRAGPMKPKLNDGTGGVMTARAGGRRQPPA